MIEAIEYRPGNAQVVHHASFRFDDAGNAARLDAATPEPGYQRFGGWGFETGGTLGGWAVGIIPQRMRQGFGRPIKARSDFIIQTHYHPIGREVTDQASVGIYFADKAPSTRRVEELFVANVNLKIPPGERRHLHSVDYTLPVATTLHAILPHMHFLGRETTASAWLPNGSAKPLIHIDDWDFNWQGHYYYAEPIRLPAGTRIQFDVVFDNSASNPMNPHFPSRTVYWGEASTAEMAVCFFDVSADTDQQLDKLIRHNRNWIDSQYEQ